MHKKLFAFGRREAVQDLLREGLLAPDDAARILDRLPKPRPALDWARFLAVCAAAALACAVLLLFGADSVQRLLGRLGPAGAAVGFAMLAAVLGYAVFRQRRAGKPTGIALALFACLSASASAAAACHAWTGAEILWLGMAAAFCAAVPGRLAAFFSAGAVACALAGEPLGSMLPWEPRYLAGSGLLALAALSGRLDRRWLTPSMIFLAGSCIAGSAASDYAAVCFLAGAALGSAVFLRGMQTEDAAVKRWGAAVMAGSVFGAAAAAGGGLVWAAVFAAAGAVLALAARTLSRRGAGAEEKKEIRHG